MYRYAALLRGIMPSNPAMANVRLRGVLEALGFEKVASVLASGNLVFQSPEGDAPALERQIEEALTRELGITSRTIIRSHTELRALVDRDPFAGLTHGRGSYLTATFLQDTQAAEPPAPPDDPVTRVLGYDSDARAILAVTDNTAQGGTPAFMSWLEASYGRGITTRTWLTVQRVLRSLEA